MAAWLILAPLLLCSNYLYIIYSILFCVQYIKLAGLALYNMIIMHLQTGLTALDIAKTQDIRELLLEQYIKEEAKLHTTQQAREKVEMDNMEKEREVHSLIDKELTEV